MAITKVTSGGLSDIAAAVEGASDSNKFTDADHTKLNGVAASANNYVHPNHSGDVVSAADGAMTIQTDAVDIAMLSATGTAGNTTFLRGDNTWATAGSTSASDLTSGTLPIARIADGAVTAAKVAADVATQAELDTVSTVASAALPKAGGTMTGVVTFDNDGAVSYNGATDLDGESFIKLEGTSADGEAAMIRWANHGNMNNYFGVVQVGAGGQGDFVWTSYDGSAYAERMRISSGGVVSKPLQPSFWASGTVASGNNLQASNVEFVFSNAQSNVGSHYSTSTGRFTAPVAGAYFFSGTVYGSPANSGYRWTIKKNNTQIQAGGGSNDCVPHEYNSVNVASTCTIILQLAANDYVSCSVRSGQTCMLYGGHSYFSGALIG